MSVRDAKILVNQCSTYSRIGNRLVLILEPRKIWGVFVFKFWGLWGSLGVLGVLGVFVFKTPGMLEFRNARILKPGMHEK